MFFRRNVAFFIKNRDYTVIYYPQQFTNNTTNAAIPGSLAVFCVYSRTDDTRQHCPDNYREHRFFYHGTRGIPIVIGDGISNLTVFFSEC